MANWFKKMSKNEKDLVCLVVFELFVFLCLCPLALINAGSWALGWLVGSIVTVFNFSTMIYNSNMLLDPESETKSSSTMLGIFYSFLRVFLFAGVLIVAAICTYKSEWFGGFRAFNVFAVALSYLPLPILLFISHYISSSREIKNKEKASSEDKQ